MGALIGDKPEREDRQREEVAMLRFLVVAALAAVVTSEADPQYFINPYYTPYQPVVSYYPQPQYPQYQVVPTVAEPKEDKTTDLKPTLYDAQPGFLTQIPKGSGKYLPDLFGWERGPDYFSKWNKVPVQLRNNRVRWRTDGQNMRNGFNSASGADTNKYTDKYSNPGSYQGRKKREAEAEPQYVVSPYTYAYPQPVATSVQAAHVPTTYAAEPGFLTQIPAGSGKYLPDVFGWERGPDYFKKWNNVPVQLRNNRVRWRTDGQMMRNGFNSASGADPNKYTDKYSYPGSYQG